MRCSAIEGGLRLTDCGLATTGGGRATSPRDFRFDRQRAEGYDCAFPRRRCARVVQKARPLNSEGAGKTGCALHPRSRVHVHVERKRTRAYRFSGEHSGLPCAVVLGLLRALPGERLSCHHHCRRSLGSNLTPAPRCQDHTTSPSASGAPRQRAPLASTASPSHVGDDGRRPSDRDGMGIYIQLIWPSEKQKSFYQRGWTFGANQCMARPGLRGVRRSAAWVSQAMPQPPSQRKDGGLRFR